MKKRKYIEINENNKEGYKALLDSMKTRLFNFYDYFLVIASNLLLFSLFFVKPLFIPVLLIVGIGWPSSLFLTFNKPLFGSKKILEKYPYLDINIDIISLQSSLKRYKEQQKKEAYISKCEKIKEEVLNEKKDYKDIHFNNFISEEEFVNTKQKVKVLTKRK